jgi:hypothetical protein
MQRACLMLTRLATAAWLGAAFFFVIVAIRPIRANVFESEDRARLAQMLFPGYYAFGVGLLGAALITGAVASGNRANRTRLRIYLALLACALGTTLVDWVWIYSPLAAMVREEVAQHIALPANFQSYHTASRAINTVSIGLSLLAAGVGFWPDRETA